LKANLLENDFLAVHIGSWATITTPAYPGRQYRRPVDYIDARVDPQIRMAFRTMLSFTINIGEVMKEAEPE